MIQRTIPTYFSTKVHKLPEVVPAIKWEYNMYTSEQMQQAYEAGRAIMRDEIAKEFQGKTAYTGEEIAAIVRSF